jgi:tRNA A-37 threonylcarbamoyl transferase component Bud32
VALAIGDVVGQYRLEQVIARGRSTVVFLARDVNLGKHVVVKALAETADSAVRRQRFIEEAQIAASLDDHPNIVSTINWGEHEGRPYIVTQYVAGLTLEELLSRQPGGTAMRPAEALAIVAQVASALDSAHRREMVHRDVKPANIIVRVDESPPVAFLLDFGITASSAGGGAGETGQFVGSADYAAPEQISGAPDIDGRADVYALGCTAFEMLTGAAPFADAPDDATRLAAHLHRPVPSAVAARSSLPTEVDDVLATAMAKDRQARFPTCGSFAAALRSRFPSGELVYARPGAALEEPVVPAPQPLRPWSGRAKALAVALVVALGVGSAVTSYLWFRDTSVAIAAPDPTTTTTSTTTTTTTTVPTTTVPPTVAPPTNLYGDVVGQPITDSSTPTRAVARSLQARTIDLGAIAAGSPLYFYAQWLRLTTPVPADAAVATATGYRITADGEVQIGGFEAGDAGTLSSATECASGGSCIALDAAVTVDPACNAADCVFSSTTLQASIRRLAALNVRPPSTTLLYQLASTRPVIGVAGGAGPLPYDTTSGLVALKLDAAPARDTTSVLTVTYDDGSTDELTVKH